MKSRNRGRSFLNNAPGEIKEIADFMDGRPSTLTEKDTAKVWRWLAENPPPGTVPERSVDGDPKLLAKLVKGHNLVAVMDAHKAKRRK